MGLKKPVSEIIKWGWKNNNYKVVGVVKDMVMASPFKASQPVVFFIDYGWVGTVTIKLKSGLSTSNALAKIGPVFKKLNPASPFEYSFVDEDYGKKFWAENRIGKLAAIFSVLAVFISCLGIFGLALFVAERRTKEIGVRKVLGATVSNLWAMLSKEFILLVAVSFLIASPFAYYFMNNWLAKYEYRTNISWWVFIVTGLGALLITLLTISFQSIKAALMNPVKSLKTE
jgi:putative ABC transport system permease protein